MFTIGNVVVDKEQKIVIGGDLNVALDTLITLEAILSKKIQLKISKIYVKTMIW